MQIISTESGITVAIHYIERHVHGNGIGIKVYGELLVHGKSWVWAHELKLNTLEELQLTPMGIDQAYGHGKYIYNKGLYGNYASIHVFDANNVLLDVEHPGPETYGSIWLDFEALGE